MGNLDKLYTTARQALRTARLSINDFVEEIQQTPINDYGDLAKMIDGILGAETELDKFAQGIRDQAAEVGEESTGPRLVPGSVAGATEGLTVARGESLKQLLEAHEVDFGKHMASIGRGE